VYVRQCIECGVIDPRETFGTSRRRLMRRAGRVGTAGPGLSSRWWWAISIRSFRPRICTS